MSTPTLDQNLDRDLYMVGESEGPDGISTVGAFLCSSSLAKNKSSAE